LHYDQKPIKNRLIIAIPMFAVTALILVYSLADAKGFDIIWRYFAWANQVLAMVTLWTITVYLAQERKAYIVTMIPAMFMTMVTMTYIFEFPAGKYIEGVGFSSTVAPIIAACITLLFTVLFWNWRKKAIKSEIKA